MKCLVCKNVDLEECELVSGLKAHNCSQCGGNWMKFENYIEWHNNNNNVQVEVEGGEKKYITVNDSMNAKLCPDCGRILTVYKVASNLNFKIEHCAFCNGIWFDKNEWENLRENKLHNKIGEFFTDSWQRKIREEERRQYFEDFYTKKFGVEDYAKIKEIRNWLNNNESKDMLLAYLMNKNPYKL
jgi:Zn-finger nucleic acid-binding protein